MKLNQICLPAKIETVFTAILAFITFACLFSCSADSLVPKPSGKGGTKIGERAADFTLRDQNGEEVSLSEFEGKVILLDISTMWCGGCKVEAADAERLYGSMKDDGLIIINVLCENEKRRPATESDCARWARKYHLTFPVLADTTDSVSRRYNNTGYIPLNVIIDRDMVIRYKKPGYNKDEIETKIRELLKK